MTMDKTISDTIDIFKITFWRIAASLIGVVVRRKNSFELLLTCAPFMVAGAVAYMLGRLIGELLL